LGALARGAPYGHDPLGTAESLERIRRDDLVEHHRALAAASPMVLAVVGDVDPKEGIARARAAFERARRGACAGARAVAPADPAAAAVPAAASDPAAAAGPGAASDPGLGADPAAAAGWGREVFVYLPGPVAEIAVGFPGARLSDPDRAGLDVLAAVLEARLARRLRSAAHRVSARSVEGALAGFLVVRASCR